MRTMPPPQLQTWLAGHDPLPIIPLHDQVIEAVGHHPMSAYVEKYWLGVIGPASLWALRRLTSWLEDCPAGYPLALAPMARELGLGDGITRNSPLIRTLARLTTFELAGVTGDALAVRLALPPLARRHLARLPAHLAERHRAEIHAEATGTKHDRSPMPPAPSRGRHDQDVAVAHCAPRPPGGTAVLVGEAWPSSLRTPVDQPR